MRKLLFILIAAAMLTSCKAKKNYTSWENAYEQAGTDAKAATVDTKVADAPVKEATKSTLIKNTYNAPVRKESVSLTYGTDVKDYCIIVGSFGNVDNAYNLKDKLISQGYKGCAIMKNAQGMSRVSISSFDTESAARTELNRVRQMGGYEDAWLLMRQ